MSIDKSTLFQKEKISEIVDTIEGEIQKLFESEKYKDYLRTMSKFHSYSLNNILLIVYQKPEATLVAGYNKWKTEFSRNVKKGEKGIKIFAPVPYKVKKNKGKVDPETKEAILGSNGNQLTETVEFVRQNFKLVSVFDVSQTEGKELPTLATDLAGDVLQYTAFLEALRCASNVPIRFEDISGTASGYYQLIDKEIVIREGMSQVQTISTIIHEIAHSRLHDIDTIIKEGTEEKTKNTKEVEAESISFAVCSYYGIETGGNSLSYIANWSSGKQLEELRSSLEVIRKTSSELIKAIDDNFVLELEDEELCVEDDFIEMNLFG